VLPKRMNCGRKVLIVGNQNGTHIGGSLRCASLKISNFAFDFFDSSLAYQGPSLVAKIAHRFFDKRPLAMREFNYNVLGICKKMRPNLLITTGMSPLSGKTLSKIKALNVECLNYLTDDPWNRAHRSNWFLEALPYYDAVFSVRRSNMQDLENQGCRKVFYLPFAYDPDLFFTPFITSTQEKEFQSEVLFIGGADRDRLPYVSSLIRAGYRVRLYGGYWEQFKETRAYAFGLADPRTIRFATACTKVALCLVRRANRDDNCMRSFEIPAIGACMLAEDTIGHREIFGLDGQNVLYFKTPEEMLERTACLLKKDDERRRLAIAAHETIKQGKHTYEDRLKTILRECVRYE